MKNIIPNHIRAIIFDYDGVLGDSATFNAYACKESAKKCGIELEDHVYRACAPGGATIRDIATCIVTHYGKPELVEDYLAYKRSFDAEYAKQVTLYDGVVETIQSLHKQYLLAVNTGTRHILVDSILAKYQLLTYLSCVIAAEDVTRGKPDPESYLLTCSKLNLDPRNCLVVEDGISGISSAKQAGCYLVGITTEYSKEKLLSLGCDQVIDSLSELMVPSAT